jgi:hypothetical protein
MRLATASKEKFLVFFLTDPFSSINEAGRVTIGLLELPPGEGRFVEPHKYLTVQYCNRCDCWG